MRLIVIDASVMIANIVPPFKEGEEVTIANTDGLHYELAEYPVTETILGQCWGWVKDRFVPLSDKDETEYADAILDEIFVTV